MTLRRLPIVLFLCLGVYHASPKKIFSNTLIDCPDAKADSGFPSASIMNGSTLSGFTGTAAECCAQCANISVLITPWNQPHPSPYIRCAAYTHIAGRACLLHPSCSDLGTRMSSQAGNTSGLLRPGTHSPTPWPPKITPRPIGQAPKGAKNVLLIISGNTQPCAEGLLI